MYALQTFEILRNRSPTGNNRLAGDVSPRSQSIPYSGHK